jgi:3D (Asp-Asp-Asp) domain-containing protein
MYYIALITAYSADCTGCTGITRSGQVADSAQYMVAADLRYWDLGDKIEICLPTGQSVIYTITDTGGAIRGKWRFDILVSSKQEAIEWGVHRLHVQELND